jgi:predicted secreted protein
MTTRLVQKQLLKPTQEFEIVDDAVNIRIKAPFKQEETLTVMLAVLNTEPTIGQSRLEFTSRVNNEPLVSLYLAKPNAKEFNAFVNLLKQKIQQEFSVFAGLNPNATQTLEGNVYEEPSEFEDAADVVEVVHKPVRVEAVQESIDMLKQYVGGDEIEPLLAALEALREEPENKEQMSRLAKEFDALGPGQGAVLTYAPYIGVLLS